MSEEAKALQRQIDQMTRQMQRLESVARSVWQGAGVSAPAATVYYLTCGQGNLLQTVGGTPYYGLKRPAAAVATVPTVTPSAVAGACPDGLSRATLYDGSGSGSGTAVWVGLRLKPGATETDDYAGVVSYGTPLLARSIVMMPLVSDATVLVPVYAVWRV